MAGRGEIAAVLTGDIVRSSDLSEERLEEVRAIVADAAKAIDTWGDGVVEGAPEFFRGDSWQLMLRKPEYLLRATLLIRARLIAVKADTRVAIGLGPVSHVDPKRISLSTGEAFVLSGQALDAMKKNERMVLAAAPELGAAAGFAAAVVRLVDAEASRWTAKQAEIAAIALEPSVRTQAQIAERLRVTPQSVGFAQRGMSFDALEAALLLFEDSALKTWRSAAGKNK